MIVIKTHLSVLLYINEIYIKKLNKFVMLIVNRKQNIIINIFLYVPNWTFKF